MAKTAISGIIGKSFIVLKILIHLYSHQLGFTKYFSQPKNIKFFNKLFHIFHSFSNEYNITTDFISKKLYINI
jgi:hypothetical protein